MRIATLPLLALGAGALLVPDQSNPYQSRLLNPQEFVKDVPPPHDEASWFQEHIEPIKDTLFSTLEQVEETVSSLLETAEHKIEDIQEAFNAQLNSALGGGHHGHHGHRDHDFSDLTIYQIIKKSNYTTHFAKLIDDHKDIVKLLNSTKAEHTLFVPVDSAFEHIPHHKKPSKEELEEFIKYHIGVGYYNARRIIRTHTLPTELETEALGGPQRLRTSVGLAGVRVNFYSKIIAADFKAKNGIIHAVRSVLVPPPYVGKELSLFPSYFSTYLLAMEKTDFVKFIHGVKSTGGTTFAPTNSAFAWLGPRLNAFLFNTDKGKKYLEAILKYHFAPNATLYSDAFYHGSGKVDTAGREHYELKTLLKDASVGVDIGTLGGFVSMRVNAFARVSTTDGIAANGVIQVLDHVLIPPHKHDKNGVAERVVDDSISVEELMERLDSYLDEE